MSFFVLMPDESLTDNVHIDDHPEMDIKGYEFDEGKPLKDRFPENARYHMAERDPDGRVLYSIVSNAMRCFILSKELKEIIDIKPGSNIEFLPITILNHRGKVASKSYFIGNILSRVDAIDLNKSIYQPDPFVPSEFAGWDKLILFEDKIPKDKEIFRLEQIRTAVVIKESMKKRIEGHENISGAVFTPIEEYTSYS